MKRVFLSLFAIFILAMAAVANAASNDVPRAVEADQMASAINQAVKKICPECLAALDVDGSGTFTSQDLLLLTLP